MYDSIVYNSIADDSIVYHFRHAKEDDGENKFYNKHERIAASNKQKQGPKW